MAFPEDSLSAGEEVRLHVHPHGIAMFWPGIWALVTIGGGGAGAFLVLPNVVLAAIIGGVALILFIWLSLAPYIVIALLAIGAVLFLLLR